MRKSSGFSRAEMRKLWTGVSANILLLGLVSFITDVSSDMMWPILPMFITSLGGAGLAVGLIGGLGESLASVLKVFSGYWSDRLGRRKPLVASGYAISSAAKLGFPFAGHWPHLLVLRPLERVGKGVRTAPRDAIIADSARGARGRGFGVHRALDTSGAIVGSFLTFTLFWFLGLDFRELFLLAAVIGFFALPPLVWVKEIRRRPRRTALRISLKALGRPLRLFIGVATLFALGNFSYMFFVLKAQGAFLELFPGRMASALPILLYALFNLTYAGLSAPFGVMADKLGKGRVLAWGYSLFGVVCLGFIFSKSVGLFLGLFLAYGAFYALVDGVQRAHVSDLSPSELRATALGTFHTSVGLAALPASAVAGLLWNLNPNLTFGYGAIIAFTASASLAWLSRKSRASRE